MAHIWMCCHRIEIVLFAESLPVSQSARTYVTPFGVSDNQGVRRDLTDIGDCILKRNQSSKVVTSIVYTLIESQIRFICGSYADGGLHDHLVEFSNISAIAEKTDIGVKTYTQRTSEFSGGFLKSLGKHARFHANHDMHQLCNSEFSLLRPLVHLAI